MAPVTATTTTNQTTRRENIEKPVVAHDDKGAYIDIKQGMTYGDIALLFRQRSEKIPVEFGAYGQGQKLERALPRGKMYFKPVESGAAGAPDPSWLRSRAAVARPVDGFDPAAPSQGQTSSRPTAAATTSRPISRAGEVGPRLRASIDTDPKNMSGLQSGVIEDLNAVPPDVDRKDAADRIIAAIQSENIGDGFKRQLEFVVRAWEQNSVNIDSGHRNELWTRGQDVNHERQSLDAALGAMAAAVATTSAPASAAPAPGAPAIAAKGAHGELEKLAGEIGTHSLKQAEAGAAELASAVKQDPTLLNNPDWIKAAHIRLASLENELGQRDHELLKKDVNYKYLNEQPVFKFYREVFVCNARAVEGFDFSANSEMVSRFWDDYIKLPRKMQMAIMDHFPTYSRQMGQGANAFRIMGARIRSLFS